MLAININNMFIDHNRVLHIFKYLYIIIYYDAGDIFFPI